MKILKLLIIVFIILPISSNCQSEDLLTAKIMIKDLGLFDSGEKGNKIQYQLEKVSSNELSTLMLKGYSLEKIYAFWAYAKRADLDYRTYFPRLVNDTSKVKATQVGCMVYGPREVGRYIFFLAENLGEGYGSYKTYPHYLDSMALEIESYEGIRGNINCRIMNFEAPKNLYSKIRAKAIKGEVPSIIGLSSYRNEQDIELIKKHLTPDAFSILSGLKCVEKFPHPAFEDDVLAIFYSKMEQKHPLSFNYVCEILMKYETPKVEAAFNELISNPDKYYFQIIGLWQSFYKSKKDDHPIKIKLIKKLGQEAIDERLKKYTEMNYWKIASKENKN